MACLLAAFMLAACGAAGPLSPGPVTPPPTAAIAPGRAETATPQLSAAAPLPIKFSDLQRLEPTSAAATLAAVCPGVGPFEQAQFGPNDLVRGPAMVFPQDLAAWQDFYHQSGPRAEVYPLDHAGAVGIEVPSGAEIIVPPTLVVHTYYTAKGADYAWVPVGRVYRFSTDDDMFFYAACVRLRAGP